MTELSRKGRPAAPIRQIHLGLGAFFRAHQAWYTDACLDGEQWGIAAFTGRSTRLATTLTAQDGLYTLVSRGAQCDSFSIIRSLSRAHAGTDTRAWLDYFSAEQISIVSLTVTEGSLAGTTLTLIESGVLLGRNPECTLVLDDDFASGRHARVFRRDGGWVVEDLGSTNGTYMGSTRLTKPTPVEVGSTLRIGKTIFELRK